MKYLNFHISHKSPRQVAETTCGVLVFTAIGAAVVSLMDFAAMNTVAAILAIAR